MHHALLQPVVALAVWTLLVWLWMYATRLPAMKRAGIDGLRMVGSTGRSLRDDLVAKGELRASWVADNYNHLHEAPTVFYAVALVLAVCGQAAQLDVTLAWTYVALRVVHTLAQVWGNRVAVRFAVFSLSSLALMALVARAAMAVWAAPDTM
jgi:hypothetical protein